MINETLSYRGFQRRAVYMLSRGVIPCTRYHIWTVLVCTGLRKSITPRDVTAREGKTTAKQSSTGIVWMGTGNKDFHANHLGGNGKSRFLRGLFEWDHRSDICPGTGINPNSCEILRDFARGNLSEDCP